MDEQTRTAMTDVSGITRGFTHPSRAIAAWMTLIGLYFASWMGPFSLPKSVERVLFVQSPAVIQSPNTR
jgi:hypothetical protein